MFDHEHEEPDPELSERLERDALALSQLSRDMVGGLCGRGLPSIEQRPVIVIMTQGLPYGLLADNKVIAPPVAFSKSLHNPADAKLALAQAWRGLDILIEHEAERMGMDATLLKVELAHIQQKLKGSGMEQFRGTTHRFGEDTPY